MTLVTTDKFISASATGTDWRDTARNVLEKIESVRTEEDGFNVGFIYVSDVLSAQASNILTLFKSVTKIDQWVGSVGIGICANGEAYLDEPAISVLIGRFDEELFRVFPATDITLDPVSQIINPWLEQQDAMLTIVHGDSSAEMDRIGVLTGIDRMLGGFLVGGMTSSRGDNVQFAGECVTGGMSGIAFSSEVETVTALTQGCLPLGKKHRITRCEYNEIMELDGQRAFDVFTKDLEGFAEKKADDSESARRGDGDGEKAGESLFRGEIHAAFPVSGSDQQDYVVRNIMGVDSEGGHLFVGMPVENGDYIMFVQRDENTVRADLSKTLLELRERVQKEQGGFRPKGAIYISCVARAEDSDGSGAQNEMKLVQEIIGDVPLAGFYAYGEISNKRLYAYTAILILFL